MRGLSGVTETTYILTGFESHREMPLSKPTPWLVYVGCVHFIVCNFSFNKKSKCCTLVNAIHAAVFRDGVHGCLLCPLKCLKK